MPKKITPSLFNQRCAFGSVKTVQNEANMGQHIEFLASFSLWCYAKKRTLRQEYEVYNTELADSIVLVIRHNPNVNKQLKVKYRGTLYDILTINADDSFNFMAYDYLTVQEIKEAGGKSGR